MRSALLGLALPLLACTSRAAPTLDGATSSEARAQTDGIIGGRDLHLHLPLGDLRGSFCSGPGKIVVDGDALAVQEVKGNQYMSAAHLEGADVSITAISASGQPWEVRAQVMVGGLKNTITDKPFPNTVAVGPPAGLESHVFFRSPPSCPSGGTCQISALLWTESDKLSGFVTLTGKDYRGPCQMELCLFATASTTHEHPVQAAMAYVPAVTIPYWRIPGF